MINAIRVNIHEVKAMIDEILRDEPGFDEARDAIRETADRIRNETDDQRVAREARYEKYVEAQGLLDAIQGDDTAFIRASWLLKQERGYVLPKRGELPPEALISGDELRRSYEGRDKRWPWFPIIAVSHCWRTRVHPDPEGVTTRLLQEQLDEEWYRFTEIVEFSDVGIFFDWCSLWQSPRTPKQQKSFDQALPAINLWYSHGYTYVWLVTDARVPHADGRVLGYAAKGWTMFEFALTGKIKWKSFMQIKELGDGLLGITRKTPKPPREPLSFREGHRYGDQVYTNGADRDRIVAPLFKKATEDILGGVKKLNYFGQNWNDVHAARLGLVLPLCVSLRTFTLSDVGLTARGLRAILEPVVDDKALSKLETLEISWNKELGDEGACALGAALKTQGSLENLRTLYVSDCNLTATGLRAILEPVVDDKALSKLEYLDISKNKELGDEGACALGAALKKQGVLENMQVLEIRDCNLTATGLRAILEPVVDDKALSKLDISENKELGDEGARALGAALKERGALENLQMLHANDCNLTATGLRAILEPVVDDKALPKLELLQLCGNSGYDDDRVRSLVAAFAQDELRKDVLDIEFHAE